MTDKELLELAVISKADAVSKGVARYFTGKPCRRGHVSERFVSAGACVECQYKNGAELYLRQREKAIARQKAYRAANPEKQSAYHKKWYAINSERKAEKYRQYRIDNIKKEAARHIRYRENNLAQITACEKAYRSRSHDKLRAKHAARRALKLGADGHYNERDVQKLKTLQGGRCAACKEKVSKFHVDHIVPLVLGGSNWPNNLQILCQTCNLKKHAKDPIVWANQRGMLL